MKKNEGIRNKQDIIDIIKYVCCPPKLTIKKNNMRIKLYWVSDCYGEHGDENWFVFAKSKISAEIFYIDYEGMDRGQAEAKLIDNSEPCHNVALRAYQEYLEMRKVKCDKLFMPVHAQIDHLKELGFEIISDGESDSMRIVSRNGKLYQEGGLESLINLKRKNMDSKTAILGMQNN